MGINDAFDALQKAVDADRAQVLLARSRRDIFKRAFGAEGDVVEVFGSGSLRRSTQLKPIHDVDLVVMYAQADHPGWGLPGDSAEEALDYTRRRVNDLLGATYGSVDQLVRLARWRNHAVKCFVDDPEDPEAFTVDTMPALRAVLPGTRLRSANGFPDCMACEPQVVGNTQLAPQWPVDTVAAATVTVVGAGSIGGATVQALAEYGVGRLLLVDPDHLLWHNLVRHVEAQFEQGRLGARARIG